MEWLAGMGALVTVLLMTFEPFSQQAIDFKEKVVMLRNESGRISYATDFTDLQFVYGGDSIALIPDGKFMRSVWIDMMHSL